MKISPQVTDKLSGWAEEYYNPDLPYHNWGHAEEVMGESLELLNRNGRWTRGVNRPLLQIAAAWHDAGHDHEARHDFESPEHYSAYLMRERLKGQLPKRQLDELEETILGTRYLVARDTMAALALHYGDVGNMAHEYPSFYDHSVRLWREYGRPDWEDWKTKALKVIGNTATEAFLQLPALGIREDIFRYPARQNMARLRVVAGPTE